MAKLEIEFSLETPDTPSGSVLPPAISVSVFRSVYLFPLFPAAFHATGRVSSLPRRRNVTRLGSVVDPWQGGGIVLLAPRESSLIVIELIDTRSTWGSVELLVARSPGNPPKWESLSRC